MLCMTAPEITLTHLDEPLFDGAGATKRDLGDYLEAVADRIVPLLSGRPLSVIRVRAGQRPFMQKNVPDYAPPWIKTVSMWAESSHREVRYALCEDKPTLIWFANQRPRSSRPIAAAWCSSTRPGRTARPWRLPTARERAPACRSRSRWPGTRWTRCRLGTSRCGTRRGCWGTLIPGLLPRRRLRRCLRTSSRRATRSRSPGYRPCT